MSRLNSLVALLARLALLGLSVVALGVLAALSLTGRLASVNATASGSIIALLLATCVVTGYCAFRLGKVGVTRVAFEIGAFFVALYGAEILMRVLAPEPPTVAIQRKINAERLGVPFDFRTKSDIVAELRSKGVDALPGISREWPRQSRVRQRLPEGMFPLSHASNADIVECNESGSYLTYHSDEYGFNNPLGLVASGKVDAAAVGASFTLGHCVPNGTGIVAQLRQTIPRLANFGMAGSGTLSMLASFREYVEPLKPPLVLWIMHPWTADTRDESGDPILQRYLEPGFSQHLFERRAEVDQVMRNIAVEVQYEADAAQRRAEANGQAGRWAGVITLSALRSRMHLAQLMAKPPEPVDLRPWDQAIDVARKTTAGWGGRFVVVIMPLYAEVISHDLADPLHHDKLAARMRARGIEVIDTVPVFLDARDPNGLYVMRTNNHPTPEGHHMLADYIASQLTAQARGGAMVARSHTQ